MQGHRRSVCCCCSPTKIMYDKLCWTQSYGGMAFHRMHCWNSGRQLNELVLASCNSEQPGSVIVVISWLSQRYFIIDYLISEMLDWAAPPVFFTSLTSVRTTGPLRPWSSIPRPRKADHPFTNIHVALMTPLFVIYRVCYCVCYFASGVYGRCTEQFARVLSRPVSCNLTDQWERWQGLEQYLWKLIHVFCFVKDFRPEIAEHGTGTCSRQRSIGPESRRLNSVQTRSNLWPQPNIFLP